MWNLFCEQTRRFFPNRPLDLRRAFSSHQPLHVHTCWELRGVHRQLGQPSFLTGATNASLMGPNGPLRPPRLLSSCAPSLPPHGVPDWTNGPFGRALHTRSKRSREQLNVNICTSLGGRFLGNGQLCPLGAPGSGWNLRVEPDAREGLRRGVTSCLDALRTAACCRTCRPTAVVPVLGQWEGHQPVQERLRVGTQL